MEVVCNSTCMNSYLSLQAEIKTYSYPLKLIYPYSSTIILVINIQFTYINITKQYFSPVGAVTYIIKDD